jgi:hypothetical protein
MERYRSRALVLNLAAAPGTGFTPFGIQPHTPANLNMLDRVTSTLLAVVGARLPMRRWRRAISVGFTASSFTDPICGTVNLRKLSA